MRKNLAKTLLAAAGLAAGLSSMAHAGVRGEAPWTTAAPGHNGPSDPFTDGARSANSETIMLPVVARQGMSVCAVRGFDPYQDGMRKLDPYADGGRISSRDGYIDGSRSQGDERGAGECLSAPSRAGVMPAAA